VSTPLDEVVVEFGSLGAEKFTDGGGYGNGDWQSADVQFAFPFSSARPHVVVSPTDFGVTGHNAGVVGLAADVSSSGFRLWGRSPDCGPGQAGFNWLAVLEMPGQNASRGPLDVRWANLQPLSKSPQPVIFAPNCEAGDTQSWPVAFNRRFADGSGNDVEPTVLITASNLNASLF
jgi:hypothetical protein